MSADRLPARKPNARKPKIEWIDAGRLHFDRQSARSGRLARCAPDEDIIENILDNEPVQDLMASIGQQGIFATEPFFVVEEDGRFVVIDGNRRLAAIRLLSGEIEAPRRRLASVEQIRQDAVHPLLGKLPCIRFATRRDALRHIGFRHITGIKAWDTLAKARYLDDCRNASYADLPARQQMKLLAKDSGSRPEHVGQLLTAFGLYRAAEKAKFFRLPIRLQDVELSRLAEALDYPAITGWMGLDGKTDFAMPSLNPARLEKVFAWLFLKDRQGRTVVRESCDLGKLSDVLSNDHAIEALEETQSLDNAWLHSEGAQQALGKAISQAAQSLQTVWHMLLDARSLTPGQAEQARHLAGHARAIHGCMLDRMAASKDAVANLQCARMQQ